MKCHKEMHLRKNETVPEDGVALENDQLLSGSSKRGRKAAGSTVAPKSNKKRKSAGSELVTPHTDSPDLSGSGNQLESNSHLPPHNVSGLTANEEERKLFNERCPLFRSYA